MLSKVFQCLSFMFLCFMTKNVINSIPMFVRLFLKRRHTCHMYIWLFIKSLKCKTLQVCFCERLGAICIQFSGCGHVYCKECMKGYFEVQINDGSVKCLECPSDKCESQAYPGQVSVNCCWKSTNYNNLIFKTNMYQTSDL